MIWMQYVVFRTPSMFNHTTVKRQLPITNACTAFCACESPKEITFPDKNGSKRPSVAATRQGVLFYALESREDCFIFQAVYSQGRPVPYKSITYHTALWVMFHYSVIFSRVGSTQGCKGQAVVAVVVVVADGFIIRTCADFTISNECI